MDFPSIDILMITYNRAAYTRLSLARLLDTCDASMRVWVWHNGTDRETLEVVESMRNHPRFHRFHHSPENKKLREPTNWLWENARGDYLSKVDDDCLVTPGWASKLREAHLLNKHIGIVACCHFWPGDLELERCAHKIIPLDETRSLLTNCWVGGSGYLMKRQCVTEHGLLHEGESWTGYCLRLARAGWRIGWILPLVQQEHMDDPRSSHTMLKTDDDICRWVPLSAQANGVTTVKAWQAQLMRSAQRLPNLPSDPRAFSGYRLLLLKLRNRLRAMCGVKQRW